MLQSCVIGENMNKALKYVSLIVVAILSILFIISTFVGLINISQLINELSDTYYISSLVKFYKVALIILAIMVTIMFLILCVTNFLGEVGAIRKVTIVCMTVMLFLVFFVGLMLFQLNVKAFTSLNNLISVESDAASIMDSLSTLYSTCYEQLFWASLGGITLAGLTLWFNPEEVGESYDEPSITTPQPSITDEMSTMKNQYREEIGKLKDQIELQQLKEEYESLKNQLKK